MYVISVTTSLIHTSIIVTLMFTSVNISAIADLVGWVGVQQTKPLSSCRGYREKLRK